MDEGYRRRAPRDETRQGIYAATPDGAHLGSGPFHPDPQRTLDLLTTALDNWAHSAKSSPIPGSAGASDSRYAPPRPAGSLALNVYTRIPIPPEPGKWTPNNATGRDHMWITREELEELQPRQWRTGETVSIPKNLAARLLRFHLVDNVRGEPSMWESGDVTESALSLVVDNPGARTMKLTGSARLKSPDSARGYDARIQGYWRYEPASGRLLDARMLSWGEAWGSGRYTRGAPPGRFPLLIAFEIAGSSPTDQVPPQAARWLPGYLRPE